MQQRRLRLGDTVDDYCPRERRLTNHLVAAMVDDQVTHTRCTTCDADHDYKQARVPTLRRKRPEGEPVADSALVPGRVVLPPVQEEAEVTVDEAIVEVTAVVEAATIDVAIDVAVEEEPVRREDDVLRGRSGARAEPGRGQGAHPRRARALLARLALERALAVRHAGRGARAHPCRHRVDPRNDGRAHAPLR